MTYFTSTFNNCRNLVLNRNIFYNDGEQDTRFASNIVNFSTCFRRTVYDNEVAGEAPDLWDCVFVSVTSTNCFGGNGNSLTSITNYNDIPSAWGGPA